MRPKVGKLYYCFIKIHWLGITPDSIVPFNRHLVLMLEVERRWVSRTTKIKYIALRDNKITEITLDNNTLSKALELAC